MIRKALLLATMLIGIRGEPQGPAYLPPSVSRPPGTPGGGTGHPDEWAGDPANYEFSYEVQDAVAGLDFGHREMRKDQEATGTYHVLLPDGRTQIIDYVADNAGYRPMVRYEGTATYPAPAPSAGGGGGGGDDGYRY
ncbi:pro-resilin-like [Vespa mandarinia]|uniref:pro-resilin-like n=1 Tax=Vespa mandarinia TaxID=7446 RepID=UPI00161A8E00|nr:pro-resilin-like [Vespa mandarinia]XP_035729094.1 pro-resilin-like [Vespa mandarinia]XP_046823151.1 pro-resilin-like [Vespa crabro]XP_046823152.1 pro-resilin-like [Vespa crabro]XP_047356094.1 pro-resilin-like [Vespa velutina]XP_047356095.1 pro-resilin-like [Vespa velutina]